MTRSLVEKFRRHLSVLEQTVNRECDLDHSNPKLYRKVRKFYQNEGVQLSGDPLDDYEIVIELLSEDLVEKKV